MDFKLTVTGTDKTYLSANLRCICGVTSVYNLQLSVAAREGINNSVMQGAVEDFRAFIGFSVAGRSDTARSKSSPLS